MRDALFTGRLACIGIQKHCQHGDGFFIILAMTANVADPGWKILHGDQFLTEPGEVRDESQAHHACGTFTTRSGFWNCCITHFDL
jgi:hypothetical protein